MTDAATTSAPSQPARQAPGRSLWGDARRRLARDRSAMICLAIIGVYVLAALGGIAYDLAVDWSGGRVLAFEDTADFAQSNQPPSLESWRAVLGMDWAGRSVLLKTILGAKVSITVGFMANIIAVPLGLLLGALAGVAGPPAAICAQVLRGCGRRHGNRPRLELCRFECG